MQTTLTQFIDQARQTNALPLVETATASGLPKKRERDDALIHSYPKRSSASRSVPPQLRLLNSRYYSRHHCHSQYAATANTADLLADRDCVAVRPVCPCVHPTRVNEDGEPLVSSVNVYKNSVSDLLWDPKDEFLIVTRRSRFQLFGTASIFNCANTDAELAPPILDFKVAAVQSRLGAENRISFGLSSLQFVGNTLNVACGYNGAAYADVFDLEDVDEESGAPLCSFDLTTLSPRDEDAASSTSPSVTALVSLSDSLAVAAMSNGCSAFLDLRTGKPTICTRAQRQTNIVSSLGDFANRDQRRKCTTAIALLGGACDTQVVTGKKEGVVELWDLRRGECPIAETTVFGSVETLRSATSSSSSRCGAPSVWLNTNTGAIMRFSVGADSFQKLNHVNTEDVRRSQSSASLASPKLAFAPAHSRLIYPHVTSNTLLVYAATDDGPNHDTLSSRSAAAESDQQMRRGLSTNCETSEFKDARSLLREQNGALQSENNTINEHCSDQDVPLLLSMEFSEWSYQICSVSVANRHDVIAVGGDDGDVHILSDNRS